MLADRMQRPMAAQEETVRHYHTWLPRQMVTVGLYGGLLMPVALYFLDDDEHIGYAKGRVVVDPVGQESLRVVAGVASPEVAVSLERVLRPGFTQRKG